MTASFKYDAIGRRIEKTINGTTTQYVYDGLDIIQEIQGTAKTNYIRTRAIDKPLTRIKADGTVRHYVKDALGSVIALVDDTGVVKTTYTYDLFGSVTITGEILDNPFQYTGRENDGISLYYYRARYYSSELQKFISEDPIRLKGGLNFYGYVGNKPINYVDPLGLFTINWGVGGVLGIFDINWNSSDPTQTNINLTTPQLGGGFNICFNKKKPKCDSRETPLEELPLTYSVGSRYLGGSFTDNFDSICINIGLAEGPLPINVGIPLNSIGH